MTWMARPYNQYIKIYNQDIFLNHFIQNKLKGDMTRYLLMSMNLGIWNIKHAFT